MKGSKIKAALSLHMCNYQENLMTFFTCFMFSFFYNQDSLKVVKTGNIEIMQALVKEDSFAEENSTFNRFNAVTVCQGRM